MEQPGPTNILFKLQMAVDEFQAALKNISEGSPPGITQQQSVLDRSQDVNVIASVLPENETDSMDDSAEVAHVLDNTFIWLDARTIESYKIRGTAHKSECEKLKTVIRCFAAHLRFIEGDNDIIELADALQNELLGFINQLENVFSVAPDETKQIMIRAEGSLRCLTDHIRLLRLHLDEKFASSENIWQWESCLWNGSAKVRALIAGGKFAEYLDYIHNNFFPDLEAVMASSSGALVAIQEKNADDWIAAQKPDVKEDLVSEYLEHVFSGLNSTRLPIAWPTKDKVNQLRRKWVTHKLLWVRMSDEIGHLTAQYDVVGGDDEVIKSAKAVQEWLIRTIDSLKEVLDLERGHIKHIMKWVKNHFGFLSFAASAFKRSLYHQKHAFYFREVSRWVDCLWDGLHRIYGFFCLGEYEKCLDYILEDLLSEVERTVLGVPAGHKVPVTYDNTPEIGTLTLTAGSVAEELKIFGERSLPTFLVNNIERDTTRFVNITTIATFFSSVTATTLQFTFNSLTEQGSEHLRGTVNLFWFVSLVFSVSSGVSSLLGLTWRKSSIYDSRKPPVLIRMWFDKAPMFSLIIAAVTFVIGLNLFAYLSLQPRYVSLATNIFTGMHGMCLLAVTAWFVYQIKHESVWARWVRLVSTPMRKLVWFAASPIAKRTKASANLISKGVSYTATSISYAVKWLWRLQYKADRLHMRRNCLWALGMDRRVARLTMTISALDWRRKWPSPSLALRIIRSFVLSLGKCRIQIWHILQEVTLSALRWMISLSRYRREADVEVGRESEDQNQAEEPATTPKNTAEKVESDFRALLRSMFGESALVQEIMSDIEVWSNGWCDDERLQQFFDIDLWGYPDLVQKFHQEVGPALIEARNDDSAHARSGEAQLGLGSLFARSNHSDPSPWSSESSFGESTEIRYISVPEVVPVHPDTVRMGYVESHSIMMHTCMPESED